MQDLPELSTIVTQHTTASVACSLILVLIMTVLSAIFYRVWCLDEEEFAGVAVWASLFFGLSAVYFAVQATMVYFSPYGSFIRYSLGG